MKWDANLGLLDSKDLLLTSKRNPSPEGKHECGSRSVHVHLCAIHPKQFLS